MMKKFGITADRPSHGHTIVDPEYGVIWDAIMEALAI